MGGSLERLSLSAQSESGLCVTSWAAALRRLVRLSLWADRCTLRLCSSLSGLTALTALGLDGAAVKIDASAQLPPNVEILRLTDRQGEVLPPQVRAWSARVLAQGAMPLVRLQVTMCRPPAAQLRDPTCPDPLPLACSCPASTG